MALKADCGPRVLAEFLVKTIRDRRSVAHLEGVALWIY